MSGYHNNLLRRDISPCWSTTDQAAERTTQTRPAYTFLAVNVIIPRRWPTLIVRTRYGARRPVFVRAVYPRRPVRVYKQKRARDRTSQVRKLAVTDWTTTAEFGVYK